MKKLRIIVIEMSESEEEGKKEEKEETMARMKWRDFEVHHLIAI